MHLFANGLTLSTALVMEIMIETRVRSASSRMWDKEFIILRTSGTWKETSENIVGSFGESIGKIIIGTH